MCSVKINFYKIILLSCLYELTETAWLRCYSRTMDDYHKVPLDKDLPSSFISCIDKTLPTVIYTFGYRGRPNGPATTAVISAYIATKKRNVILLDWEEEAKSGLLGISMGYALYAVPNAKKIGRNLGQVLVTLSEAGVNMSNVHLVGHSLGAHIMAYAGREAREQGYVVSRVTGLDPARALFEGTLAIQTGIDRTCARFVDIVHSDPGGYGTSTSTGTVDIWPNYTGKKSMQPGCEEGDYEMFSPEDLCKHDRAWQYYVEAIYSPTSFPAIFATDFENWRGPSEDNNDTIYLGELTNTKAKGNYYLNTDAKSPFGKGSQGLIPERDQTTTRTLRDSPITRLLKYLR